MMPRLAHGVLCALSMWGAAPLRAALAPDAIRGFFYHRGGDLSFDSGAWTLKSSGDLGWVSLKAGGVEFLHAEDKMGGFAFVEAGRTFSSFPDRSNIAHDESTGRIGITGDGIRMIKWIPHRTLPQCDLYLGSNSDGPDLRVLMFLGCGVEAGKAEGESMILRREKVELRVIPQSPGKDASGVPLPGPQLEYVEVAPTGGAKRPALSIQIKGFAPNTVRFEYDGREVIPSPVVKPSFAVKSPADPGPGEKRPLGPTNGVINPIYGPDTMPEMAIRFGWNGTTPFEGFAELEVVHSLGGVDYHERQNIQGVSPGTGECRVVFHPVFQKKGVSDVWVRLADHAGNLVWTDRYRMAYDWPNFKPDIRVEPDFKEFWDSTLRQLRQIPLDPKTERVERLADAPGFEVHLASFNSWNHQRIHAMVFVPKTGRAPYPAIVTAHPGTTGFGINKRADGVYGSKIKHDPRFVTIVPLVRGHEPDAADIPFNHPWWGPLGDRDTYVARSWYCTLVRAVDYLATRPDWVDMNRVVAKGGSQGGAFALVTAALDSRIAYCLADCPANCQPHEIMDHYASFGPSRGQVPAGKTVEETQRALSYYNPVNFAPFIRCPAYVGSNIGDLTVHSMGPLAAYHNLTGLKPSEKAFYPGFTHFHGSGPGLAIKTREVLERLGGVLPLEPGTSSPK